MMRIAWIAALAAFAASPLVKRHDHVTGGPALSWVFAHSTQQVETRE